VQRLSTTCERASFPAHKKISGTIVRWDKNTCGWRRTRSPQQPAVHPPHRPIRGVQQSRGMSSKTPPRTQAPPAHESTQRHAQHKHKEDKRPHKHHHKTHQVHTFPSNIHTQDEPSLTRHWHRSRRRQACAPRGLRQQCAQCHRWPPGAACNMQFSKQFRETGWDDAKARWNNGTRNALLGQKVQAVIGHRGSGIV
jgi:hypothetical protein